MHGNVKLQMKRGDKLEGEGRKDEEREHDEIFVTPDVNILLNQMYQNKMQQTCGVIIILSMHQIPHPEASVCVSCGLSWAFQNAAFLKRFDNESTIYNILSVLQSGLAKIHLILTTSSLALHP